MCVASATQSYNVRRRLGDMIVIEQNANTEFPINSWRSSAVHVSRNWLPSLRKGSEKANEEYFWNVHKLVLQYVHSVCCLIGDFD